MRVDQKDQVTTLGILTDCKKSSTHSLVFPYAMDLSSINAKSREAVSFHMESVYQPAHRQTLWSSGDALLN